MNNNTASSITLNTVLTKGKCNKIVMTQEKYHELKLKVGDLINLMEITIADEPLDEANKLVKQGFKVIFVPK